jgi:hypothetical protein
LKINENFLLLRCDCILRLAGFAAAPSVGIVESCRVSAAGANAS